MSDNAKIAWYSIGLILLGFWSVYFLGMMIFASIITIRDGVYPDGIGIILSFAVLLLFCVLPGFGAWKCFKGYRRLARKRNNNFIQKDAFE